MTILVTGAAGQLGRDAVIALDTAARSRHAFTRVDLDLTDHDLVGEALAALRPQAVINAAAYTAVDAAESHVELAHAVNEHAVVNLAEACRSVGAHLVHVSTDYVFDGTLDRPYVETDATNPQSAYGRSKLAGERAAIELLGDGATIARTSWVCGEHGNNMVKLVRRLAESGASMEFVDDQRGHPTFTADLAPALVTLADERPGGLVHLTNSRAVSWYEFVGDVLDASGHDRSMVRPITTAELDPPRPAPRPANSVLDNARWRSFGLDPLRDYREPLAELVARL